MANAANIVLTAEDRTKAAFASAQSGLDGLKGAAGALNSALGAVGVAVSVGGLAAYVKGTIDAADAMNDMAVRTGTSVEALARYQLAASQAGTDLESLSQSMGKLSVYMAKNREEAASLGLTAKDPVEAFAQLADVIGQVEDPAQRNALAMKVLGKSYAEVMPLLAQGGDALREQAAAAGPYAERMAKMAKSADEFNDALAAIGQSAQVSLAPLVTYLSEALTAAVAATEGLKGMEAALVGGGQLGTIPQTLAVTWAEVAYVFQQVGDSMGNVAAKYQAFYTGNFKQAMDIERMGEETAAKRRAEHDAQIQRIMNPGQTLQKIGGNRYSGATDFIEAQEEALKDLRKVSVDATSVIDADKFQDNLKKAFDTKPIDDHIAKLKQSAVSIRSEYAKLAIDLESMAAGGGTGGGLGIYEKLGAAKSAFGAGDTLRAQAALDKAKSSLKSGVESGEITGFESSYYVRELQALETKMNAMAQSTAETTRAQMEENFKTAQDIFLKNRLSLSIDFDELGRSIKEFFSGINQELTLNPTVNLLQSRAPAGPQVAEIAWSSTAVGAR